MLLAYQHSDLQAPLPAGFDRYYIGERFCVRRFLREKKRIVRIAASAPGEAWLAVPWVVLEDDMDKIIQAIEEMLNSFKGIIIGDIGLGLRICGKAPLVYAGPAMNHPAAKQINDALGLSALRLIPPTLETIRSVSPLVPTEGVIHGSIPLGATPRCLTRTYVGCEECDKQRIVEGLPQPMIQRGNSLYAANPLRAYGVIDRLIDSGLSIAVVEGLGLTATEAEQLAGIYRGEKPAPDRLSNAMFFASSMSGLDSEPWMELVDENGVPVAGRKK